MYYFPPTIQYQVCKEMVWYFHNLRQRFHFLVRISLSTCKASVLSATAVLHTEASLCEVSSRAKT